MKPLPNLKLRDAKGATVAETTAAEATTQNMVNIFYEMDKTYKLLDGDKDTIKNLQTATLESELENKYADINSDLTTNFLTTWEHLDLNGSYSSELFTKNGITSDLGVFYNALIEPEESNFDEEMDKLLDSNTDVKKKWDTYINDGKYFIDQRNSDLPDFTTLAENIDKISNKADKAQLKKLIDKPFILKKKKFKDKLGRIGGHSEDEFVVSKYSHIYQHTKTELIKLKDKYLERRTVLEPNWGAKRPTGVSPKIYINKVNGGYNIELDNTSSTKTIYFKLLRFKHKLGVLDNYDYLSSGLPASLGKANTLLYGIQINIINDEIIITSIHKTGTPFENGVAPTLLVKLLHDDSDFKLNILAQDLDFIFTYEDSGQLVYPWKKTTEDKNLIKKELLDTQVSNYTELDNSSLKIIDNLVDATINKFYFANFTEDTNEITEGPIITMDDFNKALITDKRGFAEFKKQIKKRHGMLVKYLLYRIINLKDAKTEIAQTKASIPQLTNSRPETIIPIGNLNEEVYNLEFEAAITQAYIFLLPESIKNTINLQVFNDGTNAKILKDELKRLVEKSNNDNTLDILVNEKFTSGANVKISVYPNLSKNITLTTDAEVDINKNDNMVGWYNNDKTTKSSTQELTPTLVAINTVGNEHFIKFQELQPRRFTNKFTNLINDFKTKYIALTFPTTYDTIDSYRSEITDIIKLYTDAKAISSSINIDAEEILKSELEEQKKKLAEVIFQKGKVDKVISSINANTNGLINTTYDIDETILAGLKNGVGGNTSTWQNELVKLEDLIFAKSGVKTKAKTILQLSTNDSTYDKNYAKLLNRGKLVEIANKMATKQAENAENAFNDDFVVDYRPYYYNYKYRNPFLSIKLQDTFDRKDTYFKDVLIQGPNGGANYSSIRNKFLQANSEKKIIDNIINNYNTNFTQVAGFKKLKLDEIKVIDNFPQHYLEALYNEMKRLYQSSSATKLDEIINLIKTHKNDLNSSTEKAKYPDIVKLIGESTAFNTHMDDLKTFFEGRKTVSELKPPIDLTLKTPNLDTIIASAKTIDSIKTGTFNPDTSTLSKLQLLRKSNYLTDSNTSGKLLQKEKTFLTGLDQLIENEKTIKVLAEAKIYLNSSVLDKGLYGDYNSLNEKTGINKGVENIIKGKTFELDPYITALDSKTGLANTSKPISYNVSTNQFSSIKGLMDNWSYSGGNGADKTKLEEVEALYEQFNATIQTDLNDNWTINSDIKNATEQVMYWNINDIVTKIKNLDSKKPTLFLVDFIFYNNNTNMDKTKVLQKSLKDEIKKLNDFISVATADVGVMNQTQLDSFEKERKTAYTNVVKLTYFKDPTQKSTIDTINTTILAKIAARQNTLDKTRLKSKYNNYKTLLNKLIERYPQPESAGTISVVINNVSYTQVADFDGDGNSKLEQADIDAWDSTETNLINGHKSSESIWKAVDTLYATLNNTFNDTELGKGEYERVKKAIDHWKGLITKAKAKIEEAKQKATAAAVQADADLAKLNEKIKLKLDITTPFQLNTDDTQPTITSEIDLMKINGLYYKGKPDKEIFKKKVMNSTGRGPPNMFKKPVKYWTQDTYGIEIKNTHAATFSAKSIEWLEITQEKAGTKYNVNLQINKMPYTAYKITLKPGFTLKKIPENNKNTIENNFSKGDTITNNPPLGSKLTFYTYTGAVKSISDIIQSVSIETGFKLKYKITWDAPIKKKVGRIAITDIIPKATGEKQERIRGGFKLPEFLTRAGPTEEFVFGDYDDNNIVDIADDTEFYNAIKSANEITDSEWNKWLYKKPKLKPGKNSGDLNEVGNKNIRAEALNLNTARDETGDSYVDTWIKYGTKLFFTRYPQLDADGNVTGFAREGTIFKYKIHPLCEYGVKLEEWKKANSGPKPVEYENIHTITFRVDTDKEIQFAIQKYELTENKTKKQMGRIFISPTDPANVPKFFGAKITLNKKLNKETDFVWKEATSKDEDVAIKDVYVNDKDKKTVIAFVKYSEETGYDFTGVLGDFKWNAQYDDAKFDSDSTLTVSNKGSDKDNKPYTNQKFKGATAATATKTAAEVADTGAVAGTAKSRVDLVVVDSDKVAVILNSNEDISSFEINVYDDKDNGTQLSESTLTGDKSNDLNEVKRILDNNEIVHPELMPSTSVLKENPEEVSNESFRILATCLSDKSSFSKSVFCGILKVDTPNSEKTPDVDDVKIDFTIV